MALINNKMRVMDQTPASCGLQRFYKMDSYSLYLHNPCIFRYVCKEREDDLLFLQSIHDSPYVHLGRVEAEASEVPLSSIFS